MPVRDDHSEDNVTLATLKRGKTYTFHHFDPHGNDGAGESKGYYSFQRNVPTPVSDEIADLLEELTEDITDEDGEVITKDLFDIERNAVHRDAVVPKRRSRLRIIREEVEEAPIKPALRRPPGAAAKPGTFGRRKAG